MTSVIQTIPINDLIIIEKNHRPLNQEKLAVIKDSIMKIGQKTPIFVRMGKTGLVVVTGRHRLEALRQLGSDSIECIVLNGGQMEARLWRIAENLHRANLTKLQRAEQVTEWRRLIKQERRVGQVAQPGGRQPEDKGISRAAEQLGTTRDDIRRSEAIAGIAPQAKKAAAAAGMADNQSALLKIAKESKSAQQVQKVRELETRTGKKWPPLSPEHEEEFRRLQRSFERLPNFRRRWNAAAGAVRDKFIRTVLRPAGRKSKKAKSIDGVN